MSAVLNHGKRAASQRRSTWEWQPLKARAIKTGVQRSRHCRCGREKILALGLCATCYTFRLSSDSASSGSTPEILRGQSQNIVKYVEKGGFNRFEQTDITLVINQTAQINAQLRGRFRPGGRHGDKRKPDHPDRHLVGRFGY
jgi:hypothetical protein